jgi:hypothetical protein
MWLMGAGGYWAIIITFTLPVQASLWEHHHWLMGA